MAIHFCGERETGSGAKGKRKLWGNEKIWMAFSCSAASCASLPGILCFLNLPGCCCRCHCLFEYSELRGREGMGERRRMRLRLLPWHDDAYWNNGLFTRIWVSVLHARTHSAKVRQGGGAEEQRRKLWNKESLARCGSERKSWFDQHLIADKMKSGLQEPLRVWITETRKFFLKQAPVLVCKIASNMPSDTHTHTHSLTLCGLLMCDDDALSLRKTRNTATHACLHACVWRWWWGARKFTECGARQSSTATSWL